MDGIPGCTLLEYVVRGGIEIAVVTIVAVVSTKDQVEWSGSRMMVPLSSVLWPCYPRSSRALDCVK